MRVWGENWLIVLQVKLADFGMAKQLAEQLSMTKSFKGTPSFMVWNVFYRNVLLALVCTAGVYTKKKS